MYFSLKSELESWFRINIQSQHGFLIGFVSKEKWGCFHGPTHNLMVVSVNHVHIIYKNAQEDKTCNFSFLLLFLEICGVHGKVKTVPPRMGPESKQVSVA